MMWAVLSNLRYGKFMRVGARIVIGACMLAGFAAMLPKLP
jgi:hypothetical protein